MKRPMANLTGGVSQVLTLGKGEHRIAVSSNEANAPRGESN
jgi:hypothetical protein